MPLLADTTWEMVLAIGAVVLVAVVFGLRRLHRYLKDFQARATRLAAMRTELAAKTARLEEATAAAASSPPPAPDAPGAESPSANPPPASRAPEPDPE